MENVPHSRLERANEPSMRALLLMVDEYKFSIRFD